MQALIHRADQGGADQSANLDITINQLQIAVTNAKFADSPRLVALISNAIAEAMAERRHRSRRNAA